MMRNALPFSLLLAVLLLSGCASIQSGGGLSSVIAPDARVQLVQEGFIFTEGPLGTPDGGLYFTDLREANRIYRMDAHGRISVLREKSNTTNENGTLYIGVTSDVVKRVWEHKNDFVVGFTKRYGVHTLVWYEAHETMASAIAREKALKNWKRAWKLELIEASNPEWLDRYGEVV